MLTCESSEQLIVDSVYEPLNSAEHAQLESHLQSCAACRAIMQEMQSAKGTLEELGFNQGMYDDIPERAELGSIWESIQPELDKVDAERFRQLSKRRVTPFLSAALAIAASLILFIGVLPSANNLSEPTDTVTTTSLISPDLMSYLSRAETMLLLFANTETNNVSVVPVTSSFARDMALEASYLTTSMGDSFNSGQSRLLKDIEFMLLQIANLDETNMEAGIALLQEYLQDNSVLLKIRLLEMRNQGAVTT